MVIGARCGGLGGEIDFAILAVGTVIDDFREAWPVGEIRGLHARGGEFFAGGILHGKPVGAEVAIGPKPWFPLFAVSDEKRADIGDGADASGKFGVQAKGPAPTSDGPVVPAGVRGVCRPCQRELAEAGGREGSVKTIGHPQEIRGFAGRSGEEGVGPEVMPHWPVMPIFRNLHRDAGGSSVGLTKDGDQSRDARRADKIEQEGHRSVAGARIFDLDEEVVVIPESGLLVFGGAFQTIGPRHGAAEIRSRQKTMELGVEGRGHGLIARCEDLD